MWDWAIYGAVIAGALAVAGAGALLAVRALQGWRSVKRLRRHLARELERLADLGEATADKVAAASDTAEIAASVSRLRVTLARFAVLRAALDDVRGTFGPLAAVFPRK